MVCRTPLWGDIMGKWSEQLKDYPIQPVIDDIRKSLAGIDEQGLSSSSVIEDIERVRQVVELLEQRLENIDLAVNSTITLKNILDFLTNVKANLQNFHANSNIQEFAFINQHLDSLLRELSLLVVPQTVADITGIREATRSLRVSAKRSIQVLEASRDRLQQDLLSASDKIHELVKVVDQQKARLDNAIAQYQEQFLKAESSRAEAANVAETKRREEFTKAIQAVAAEVKQSTTDFSIQFTELAEKLQYEADNKEKVLVSKTDSTIQKIQELRQHAEELVHIIGNTGMMAGYQKAANSAQFAARVWQVVAVLSFISLSAFAIYAFLYTVDSAFTWAKFAARVFVASTFAILGAYAAKQAERNEAFATETRRKELELASLNPYLAELDKEIGDRLKEKMAEKFFGNGTTDKPVDEGKESPTNSAETMKELVGLIRDLTKKQE